MDQCGRAQPVRGSGGNTDTGPDAHAHTHTHTHTDSHTDSHAHAHADSNTDAHPDSHPDTDARPRGAFPDRVGCNGERRGDHR
jgi:hypothetical protein